jgi:hypothetical protein
MNGVGGNLVDQYFLIFDDEGNLDFQGQVLGRPEPGHYLCQLYNWMGEPSCAKLVHISGMGRWAFYATHEKFLDAATHRKNHASSLTAIRDNNPKNDVFSARSGRGQ